MHGTAIDQSAGPLFLVMSEGAMQRLETLEHRCGIANQALELQALLIFQACP